MDKPATIPNSSQNIYRKLFLVASTILAIATCLFIYSYDQYVSITINDYKFILEVSDTLSERNQGLMYRSVIEDNEGMLFVFPEERILSFWMESTPASLDIIYLDKDYKVINYYEYTIIQSQYPLYISTRPAKYVIELRAGSVQKHKINVNDQLQTTLLDFPENMLTNLKQYDKICSDILYSLLK